MEEHSYRKWIFALFLIVGLTLFDITTLAENDPQNDPVVVVQKKAKRSLNRKPQAVRVNQKSSMYNNPEAPLIIRKTYRPDVADYFEIDQQ